jgi:hypothetical protein
LISYFSNLRTDIEKRVENHTSAFADIKKFSGSDIAKFGQPPLGATGVFIGDQNGGSGWIVTKPDGSTETHYRELPREIGEVMILFPNAPGRYRDMPARQLVAEYLDRMHELIREARDKFA